MKEIFYIVGILFMVLVSVSAVSAQTPVCSINVGPDFDFGSLAAGTISLERLVTITNSGDDPTTSLQISGGNWISGLNSFDFSATHFSTNSGEDYSVMTPLGSSPSSLPILEQSASEDIYFKVMIPDHQDSGNYLQIITFTVSCQ